MKRSKLRTVAAIAVGSFMLLPVAAQAQTVVRYMNTIARQELPQYGLANTRSGVLEPGSTVELSFRLRAGQKYGFVAVCDDVNCNDIDLELLDASGNVLDTDVSTDDYAVVVYDPGTTIVHDLKVIMYGCSNPSGCQYSVGAYRR